MQIIQSTTPVEVLERALEILIDPAKWTKNHIALNINGFSVEPHDPAATCFCLHGAMERAAHGSIPEELVLKYYGNDAAYNAEYRAIQFVNTVLYSRKRMLSIPAFNDNPNTTHDEVVSVLTQALADARKAVA